MLMKQRALIIVTVAALVMSSAAAATATPSEAQWITSLKPTVNSLLQAGHEIARDTARTDVFVKGSTTQVRLVVALAVYSSCKSGVRSVGPAPTAATARIRASLLTTCNYFAKSATALARGIDNLDPTLIRQATGYLKLATMFMRRATAQTAALSHG